MKVFGWLKSGFNNIVMQQICSILFERIPILKKLNGYKTIIGASLICLYYVWKAVYPVLSQYFPDSIYMLADIDLLMGHYIQFVADALVVLGVQHKICKTAKEQRIYEQQQSFYN